MVTIRCQNCGRETTTTEDKWENASSYGCNECGDTDSFEIKDSEEDTYEKDNQEEDSEEPNEEDTYECNNCGEEFTTEDCIFFQKGCDEEDYNVVICKECFREKSNIKPEVIYKEKIVEKPIVQYIDSEGREVKKVESNSVFNSVF